MSPTRCRKTRHVNRQPRAFIALRYLKLVRKGAYVRRVLPITYSQARQFYLSQTVYEQAHIASALVFEAFESRTNARAGGYGGSPATYR